MSTAKFPMVRWCPPWAPRLSLASAAKLELLEFSAVCMVAIPAPMWNRSKPSARTDFGKRIYVKICQNMSNRTRDQPNQPNQPNQPQLWRQRRRPVGWASARCCSATWPRMGHLENDLKHWTASVYLTATKSPAVFIDHLRTGHFP